MERDEFEGCAQSMQIQQGKQSQTSRHKAPDYGDRCPEATAHCKLPMILRGGWQRGFAEPSSENGCRRGASEPEVETWRRRVETAP